MRLAFAKLDACGNDFVLIDARRGEPGPVPDWPAVAREVCRRRRSVGADGLVLLAPGPGLTRVVHLEPDGARTFCLNALRGVAAWLAAPRRLRSDAGEHAVRAAGPGRWEVALTPPRELRPVRVAAPDGREVAATFVDVGNPQLVVPLPDLDALERPGLMAWGKALRHDPAFPGGTNVDFVVRAADGTLHVRTYERGVEDETLSCGSGIVASACALGGAGARIPVLTRGGERQTVTLAEGLVWSDGPARVVAAGRLDLGEALRAA